MPNPNVAQGNLNRLKASVTWANFAALNVTPSFLNRNGISIAFEGVATTTLDTMTGTVLSPEPFQKITLTIHLLKTQGLAQLYEQQRQTNSVLGSGVVRSDADPLNAYDILNCGITNVAELQFTGLDAGYSVTIQGYIALNSALWG